MGNAADDIPRVEDNGTGSIQNYRIISSDGVLYGAMNPEMTEWKVVVPSGVLTPPHANPGVGKVEHMLSFRKYDCIVLTEDIDGNISHIDLSKLGDDEIRNFNPGGDIHAVYNNEGQSISYFGQGSGLTYIPSETSRVTMMDYLKNNNLI